MDKKSKMVLLATQWKESGMSRPAFAQHHGITLRSLEYWCRKLKKEQLDPASIASFIEIDGSSTTDHVNRQVQIELELVSGLRIKIY